MAGLAWPRHAHVLGVLQIPRCVCAVRVQSVLRLEAARGLLEKTSRPVTDIAFEVGFNSSQYFSTVFLQYTGLTPTGYRNREAERAAARLAKR